MPTEHATPPAKPRGRNGGRHTVSPGEPTEQVHIYLPASAVRSLRSRGRVSAVARDLILRALARQQK